MKNISKNLFLFITVLGLIVSGLFAFNVEVQAATKKAQPMKITVSKKTYKESDLQKNAKSFNIGVQKNQGTVSYKSSSSQVTVSSKGKVTVKKGTQAGTYKITVTAKGNKKYKSGTKTVKIVVTSEKAKAIAAYKKLLAQNKIKWGDETVPLDKNASCALIYLNNDSVPELVVENEYNTFHYQGYTAVYTYQNGAVKCLDTFDYFNGYFKKKGVIVYAYSGAGGIQYEYAYMNTKMNTFLEKDISDLETDDEKYYKYSSGKSTEISKKEFNSILSKKVGKTKMSTVSYWSNTSSNRSSKLK